MTDKEIETYRHKWPVHCLQRRPEHRTSNFQGDVPFIVPQFLPLFFSIISSCNLFITGFINFSIGGYFPYLSITCIYLELSLVDHKLSFPAINIISNWPVHSMLCDIHSICCILGNVINFNP